MIDLTDVPESEREEVRAVMERLHNATPTTIPLVADLVMAGYRLGLKRRPSEEAFDVAWQQVERDALNDAWLYRLVRMVEMGTIKRHQAIVMMMTVLQDERRRLQREVVDLTSRLPAQPFRVPD